MVDTSEGGIGMKIQLAGVQSSLAGVVRRSGSKESGHYVVEVQDLTTDPLTTLDPEILTIDIGNSPCTDN